MAKYQIKKSITELGKNTDKPLSERQVYLLNLMASTKNEIKKANNFLNALNHSLKMLKSLIDEVK